MLSTALLMALLSSMKFQIIELLQINHKICLTSDHLKG